MKNEGVSGARIKIAGQEVATDALHALLIESEMDLPDMAVITLNNTEEYGYSHNTEFGATVEVGPDHWHPHPGSGRVRRPTATT